MACLGSNPKPVPTGMRCSRQGRQSDRLVAITVVRTSLSKQCVGRESAPSSRGRGSFWAARLLRVGRVAYDSSRRKMNTALVAFSSTKRALAHSSFLLAAVRRVVGILAVSCGGKCCGKASAKRMHSSPGLVGFCSLSGCGDGEMKTTGRIVNHRVESGLTLRHLRAEWMKLRFAHMGKAKDVALRRTFVVLGNKLRK